MFDKLLNKFRFARLFPILLVIALVDGRPARAQSLRGLMEGYKRVDAFLLYSECATDDGKAILVITPQSNEVWFYEFFHDGQYKNSAEIKITQKGFELQQGLGGIFTRERMRIIMSELMKSQFELLTLDQFNKIVASNPTRKCPEVKPTDVYK